MTNVRLVLLLMAGTLAACGGSSSRGSGDDVVDPPADAGAPDTGSPPADAPPPSLTLGVDGHTEPSWHFATTPLGMRVSVTFTVVNTSGVATRPLAASLTGSDAAQFAIDPASTCRDRVLDPGASCTVITMFLPTGAPGDRGANLSILGSTSEVVFPLVGTAAPQLTGLGADVASLDFGTVETSHPSVKRVTLINGSPATVDLQPPAATSVFSVSATTCAATLASGASCTIDVQMLTSQLGASAGNLTIASDANGVTVPLTGTGARRIAVTIVGPGQVGSGDFSCTTGTCSGLFTGNAAGDVTLSAGANTDAAFSTWSAPCGTAADCTIPALSPVTALTATFETTTATPALHVTFAGTGMGEVHFSADADIPPCFTDCTVYPAKNSQVYLEWGTPSTFAGWSGACAGQTDTCALTMTGNLTVTATFNQDDREVTMLTWERVPDALAFAHDGNLLIGDHTRVAEITLGGTVVWSTSITGGVHGLVTDDAGRIYGAGGATPATAFVFAMSATGGPLWTQAEPLSFPRNLSDPINSPVQVSRDGLVVAAHSSTAVHVLHGMSGAELYPAIALAQIDGVAVASNGSIALDSLTGADPDDVVIYRYDVTGQPIGAPEQQYNQSVSLAYDAGDNLATVGAGFSYVKTYYDAAAGGTSWSQQTRNDNNQTVSGLVFDSGGSTVTTFEMNTQGRAMRIEQRSAAGGGLTWSIQKKAGGYNFEDDPVPWAIAADHSKRIAVAIDWFEPIIAVYQMP